VNHCFHKIFQPENELLSWRISAVEIQNKVIKPSTTDTSVGLVFHYCLGI